MKIIKIYFRLKNAFARQNIKKNIIPNLGANKLNCSKKIIKKMNKLGFSPDCYYLYNLDKNDYKEYINEVDRFMIREKINNGYNTLVTNKSIFYDVISKMANTPKLFFRIIDSKIFDESYKQLDKDNFIRYFKKIGDVKLFAKPTYGYRGQGASIIDTFPCSINDKKTTYERVYDFLKQYKDGIVVERIENNSYAKSISPNSLNTIRFVTFKKNADSTPQIAFAIHRFGGGGIIDNAANSLSVFAPVDLETGILGVAKSHYTTMQYNNHPLTHNPIAGVKVPLFEKAKKEVIRLHDILSFMDLIAWDVAICDESINIIEANAMGDIDFAQAVLGGLKNTDFGIFIKNKLKI